MPLLEVADKAIVIPSCEGPNKYLKQGIDKGDFCISFKWDKLKETTPPTLYVCNENTAFLSINKSPIHLTALDNDKNPKIISGHSVMMGYLDDQLNEQVFEEDGLKI